MRSVHGELDAAEGRGRELPLLELRGVDVVYKQAILALSGLSLDVRRAETVAVLGPNGAGKTTMLRAVTGLLGFHRGEVTKGAVSFDGVDITGERAERIARLGVGLVPEHRRVFSTLTVEENLRVGTGGRAEPARLDAAYTRFPELGARRHQAAGYLSGGEQQMVAMARALTSDPWLLALDEPSLGLAPRALERVATALADLRREGRTVLLVEQNAHLALALADRVYVVERGRVVLEGPAQEVRRDADVLEFYLGVQDGGRSRSYAEVKHYRRRKRWLS